jgi:hypothetical protein
MTFFAGNRLPASDLNDLLSKINNPRIPLINQVGTAGTASVGTAETVVVTFPSVTFVAHTAFKIEYQGLMRAGTAANVASIQFRDTNIAGTVRGGPGGFNLPTTTFNYFTNFTHYIANTTVADITRVLCVTISTTAGTAAFNASATIPYSFVVTAIGADTDWSQAVAL